MKTIVATKLEAARGKSDRRARFPFNPMIEVEANGQMVRARLPAGAKGEAILREILKTHGLEAEMARVLLALDDPRALG